VSTESVLPPAELQRLMHSGVPLAAAFDIGVEAAGAGTIRVRLPFKPDFLRPGGTVTGPALFALADLALWGVVLTRLGREELAVTTNLTLNFLRKPPPRAVIGEGRLIKLGKRLAYGEVFLYSEGDDEPVAHATGTYSIPPR